MILFEVWPGFRLTLYASCALFTRLATQTGPERCSSSARESGLHRILPTLSFDGANPESSVAALITWAKWRRRSMTEYRKNDHVLTPDKSFVEAADLDHLDKVVWQLGQALDQSRECQRHGMLP